MYLSKKWLNDFVKVDDIDTKVLCDKLTLSGSKVESFKSEGGKIDKIITGKVTSIERHPNADKLLICSVDIGANEPLQIVTGAHNLKVNDIVPVAVDGSTLYDGTKIKKGKLRGVASNGMLCSLGELGLSKHDFPEALENGIFVMQTTCELGQDVKNVIGFNDTVIDFEITPNRSDCLSVIGLARETSATLGRPLNLHTTKVKGDAKFPLDLKISVEDKKLCPYYSARIVSDINLKPSPAWMRERLRAMGVRPINNIVDITNYVMLEYGQPLHAFDLNTISGNEINVRLAFDDEKIVTLDGVERNLSKNDLIIADSEKPLAIAGVMGGENSGISENTKEIVFESANFFGPYVRVSSKKFNLRSESSARFEKGLDSNLCSIALDRACELVEELGAGKVTEKIFVVDSVNEKQVKIPLDCEFINRFLNINLSKEEMVEILSKIDCKVINNEVVVPSYRNDLKLKNDIAEEIARFYGYNKILSTPLKGSMNGGLSEKQKFKEKVKSTMMALGLSEIMTYSFVSPKSYDKLLIAPESKLRDYIEIKNPLGEDTSVMKTVAISTMLETLSRNFNYKNQNVKLFEIAKEYFKRDEDSLANEPEKLVAGLYGEDVDFFYVKGVVEEFLNVLKIRNYDVMSCDSVSYYHPGRCAEISFNGKILGIVGEINPLVLENYEIKKRAYAFEFCIDDLFEFSNFEVDYKQIPRYPSVERDIAVICDKDLPAINLENVAKQSAGKFLEEVCIFDVYTGNQVPEGKKSVALKLTLRSSDGTLTDEQVQSTVKKVMKAYEKLDIKLR